MTSVVPVSVKVEVVEMKPISIDQTVVYGVVGAIMIAGLGILIWQSFKRRR